jgi:two-component system sensor histidine kinase/response regulator
MRLSPLLRTYLLTLPVASVLLLLLSVTVGSARHLAALVALLVLAAAAGSLWLLARVVHDEPGDQGRLTAAAELAEANARLVASEAELRALIGALSDVSLVIDADGVYRKVFETRMQGQTGMPTDLVGRTIHDILPAESSRDVQAAIDEIVASRQEVSVEYRMPMGGRAMWFHGVGTPLGEREVLWVARDVTARKQAEDQLRQRESQLAEAQRLAQLGSWEVDLATGVATWSDEACRVFGLDPRGFVPSYESYIAAIHPDDREVALARTKQGMAAGSSYSYEHRIVRPTGEVRWILGRFDAVRDDQGRPARIYGTYLDVTERKTAEEALAAQQRFLRQVLDTIPNFVFAKDREGRYVVANRAVAEAYGVTIDELVGKTDADFNANADEVAAFRRDDLRVLDSFEEQLIQEESITDAMGVTRWLQTVKRPIQGIEDGATLVLGVTTDITLRKQAQEVAQTARQTAEAASQAKSEFLANMSHEIRTPMNGVLGMLELALDTELDATQREYVEIAHTSAEALLTIINDILDFSKIEAGKLELDPQPFDVTAGVADTLSALAIRANRKNIELTLDIDPAVPATLVGDVGRLRQVLINLVGNAIKFTAQGEIGVYVAVEDLTEQEAVLHVAVRDTGIGIPADKQASVFEAFAQADSSTTREFGGTGLGLAISSRLVAAMGGLIWLESTAGAGSTFHFTARLGLPADGAEVGSRAAAGTATSLRGVRVLAVDDNATNRRILEQMLKGWTMQPTLVDSGEGARDAMRRAADDGAPFAIVLVDARMPGMDGFAVCERIAADARLRSAAIMMLSSADQRGDIARCRKLGVAVHVTKPVRQTHLRDAILISLGTVGPRIRSAPRTPAAHQPTGEPSLRILMAEDNAVNQMFALSLLEKRGHRVTVVDNGQLALEALARGEYDLVLMDVQMPVLGGIEATRRIRERERAGARHTPIVAMTARAMSGDRERCLEAGMDDYVSKPIRSEELFRTIQSVVAATASASSYGDGGVSTESSGAPAGEQPAVSSPVDVARLLALLGGDEELLAELVALFATDAPERLAAARDALVRGDAAAVQEVAHALMGAAGNLRATAVRDAALHLETLASAGDLADAGDAIDGLARALEDALVVLGTRTPAGLSP